MKFGPALRRQLLLIALIVCAVFALHSSFLGAGFFLDDFEYIESLTSSSFLSVFSPFQKFFYRPVFLAWLWTFFYLFGVNAVVLHAANLVLFALVVYALGLLVFRVTRSRPMAALSALLFFLWPHKSQAIWWISCASTQLAALFFLVTLICWHRYREQGGRVWYAGALTAFLLSLGSKEDAHALPLVLVAFEIYLLSQHATGSVPLALKRNLRLYAPFAIALGAYLTCDAIALLHSVFAQAYVTEPRNRLLTALAFTHNIWPFSTLARGTIAGHLWTLVLVAAGLRLCRGHRLALFALTWLLAHCLFIGIEASPSMLGSERFVFLPALPGSLLLAITLLTMWRAGSHIMLPGAALTVATALTFCPVPVIPPDGRPALLLAAVLLTTTILVGRSGRVPAGAALLGGWVLLLAVAFNLWGGGAWGLYPALAMTGGAALMAWRDKGLWWQGALSGLLLWNAPLYSGLLFVVLIAQMPMLKAGAATLYRRWRKEQGDPGGAEPAAVSG